MEIRGEYFVHAIVVILMLGSVLMSSSVAEPRQLNLMPMPVSVQMQTGQLVIDPSFSVGISGHSDAQLQRGVKAAQDDLRRQTGIITSCRTMKVTNPAQAKLVVHCEHESKAVQELGEDESYSLEISAAGAKLDATTTLGIMRGLETFLQLVQTTSDGFAAPAITIHDKPRFPWRGLMIDVSRHFIPLDILKRNLDGMAAVKLNVFHWHLSDPTRASELKVEVWGFGWKWALTAFSTRKTKCATLIAYAHDRGSRGSKSSFCPGAARHGLLACLETGQRPRALSDRTQVGFCLQATAINPAEGRTPQVSRQLHRRNGESFSRPVLPHWRGRG